MKMSEKKETTEEKIDRLTNLVEKLIELQIKGKESPETKPTKEEEKIAGEKTLQEKADLEASLKEHHLGEVIIYDLQNNLIKRQIGSKDKKE